MFTVLLLAYGQHLLRFFFNDTATTEIYTLSLHDALPISSPASARSVARISHRRDTALRPERSEEHTSELQSRQYLVCRLLLEKKKTTAGPRDHNDPHLTRGILCRVQRE